MEVKEGYQQTDLGILPEDWGIQSLLEISTMHGRIGWQGLKQSEFTMNIDDPFLITGMNFKDGDIRWDEVYHIPVKRYEEAKQIQLTNDDVLITKDGTIGKTLYINTIPYPGKASLNSHLLVFRPLRERYIPKYLYYQLNSKIFLNHVEREKSGSTFFGITQESMGKFQIPLPPTLTEQSAIATALSDIDTLISGLENLIAKKQNINQGTMQLLLTEKRRLPGFSEKWEITKLRDICEFANGKPYEKFVTPDGKYKLITLDSISISGQLKPQHKRIDFLDNSLMKNDIAIILSDIAHGNLLGLCDVIPDDDKYVLNQRVGRIRVNSDQNPFFIKLQINSRQIFFSNRGQGTSQRHIYQRDIYDLEISCPELKEQSAIAQVLRDMDAEIKELELKLAKYKMIKQGMIHELLTGQKRLI